MDQNPSYGGQWTYRYVITKLLKLLLRSFLLLLFFFLTNENEEPECIPSGSKESKVTAAIGDK